MVSYSQSGTSSEGALNYKIKVWLPPLCNERANYVVLTLRIFTAKSSLGNTINFPRSIRGHPGDVGVCRQLPRARAWANPAEKVFALLPKRIWVKTRFSRAKHQTSVRRCANRGREEEKLSAGGRARKYIFWSCLEICVIKFISQKRLCDTHVGSII